MKIIVEWGIDNATHKGHEWPIFQSKRTYKVVILGNIILEFRYSMSSSWYESVLAAIPKSWSAGICPNCWLALMPAAGFSSPTNVDFHKYRHIQMLPHLSGYIHPQSHGSWVKNRIYDN